MATQEQYPGAADVEYISRVQAEGWGETLRAFARFAGSFAGRRVLDVGTGPGLLPRLATAGGALLAVGSDDSWEMLIRAKELGGTAAGISWLAAGATRLPFADGSFDTALATNLLFLLPDPLAGVSALARAAKPGGTVAFLNPGDTMSVDAATAYADARGMAGFNRYSLINYGRLAEKYHRAGVEAWLRMAEEGGLAQLRTESRADGLIVLVAGVKL